MIFGVLILFPFVSNLHAQAGSRRRPVGAKIPIGTAATVLDATDPAGIMLARPESNPAPPSPHAGYVVPVSQLRIPSKAIKEFERSQKAFQSGDVRASADHLQRALHIYPDFIQAHNTLGVRFVH